MRRGLFRWLSAAAGISVLTLSSASIGASPQPVGDRDGLLRRFLESSPPILHSYRGRRTLEATAGDGALRGTLEVVTRMDGGVFSYRVVSAAGSDLIRRHVLEPALEEERRAINEHRLGESAVTEANYRFGAAGSDEDGLTTIAVVPHAPSRMLLNGVIRVNARTGDLVSIDGQLSQAPSFWTPSVEIECQYGRVAGVRVPLALKSKARVRIVGTGTFAMTYIYSVVNGQAVAGAAGGGLR